VSRQFLRFLCHNPTKQHLPLRPKQTLEDSK
jgi:hypothetical protein